MHHHENQRRMYKNYGYNQSASRNESLEQLLEICVTIKLRNECCDTSTIANNDYSNPTINEGRI